MSEFKVSTGVTSQFTLPDYYNWKPFFTIQPIEATRTKQLKLWCDLIVAYFDYYKDIHTFIPSTFEYFKNDKIQRELSPAGVGLVINELITIGYLEWDDSNQTSLRIIRVSPDILANTIYDWVKNNIHGQFNEVYTMYGLMHDYPDAPFYLSDEVITRRALIILEDAGKCEILQSDEGADKDGVKFIRQI